MKTKKEWLHILEQEKRVEDNLGFISHHLFYISGWSKWRVETMHILLSNAWGECKKQMKYEMRQSSDI